MPDEHPRVAVIGAGIGGLTVAGALTARGFPVQVYEQASAFSRIGAGIQQSANAVKVLRELGLEPTLRARGFVPASFVHRAAGTGEVTNDIPLGARAEGRYGAPYLALHRGDLHDVLLAAVPAGAIHRGRRLVGLEQPGDGVELAFADGSRARADVVVGADGVHSLVRETLFGPHELRFSGKAGYRATLPASALGGERLDDNTKWWGPDRHLIVYYLTAARDEVYAMGTVPEPDFDLESWSAKGDVDVFCAAFADFHPTVRTLLGSVPLVHKWALADRDPLPRWSDGDVVVMGDAAHPMMPHMGQGAAMAVEDAAVLVRCLEAAAGDWSGALRRFEETRRARTSEMQAISAGNSFARTGKDAVDFVYGYDAWTTPLAGAPAPTTTSTPGGNDR
ncbi:FAD-dependent monooxygenase [Nocardioides endophyticus]|uniref:FAD-dependent monooxygenase n=1 Tax=Nocardioides endophyticus TaxID=1353775 RepID=A0ABP8YS59_9ACTN